MFTSRMILVGIVAAAGIGSASAATFTTGTIGSGPAAGETIFADYDTITPTPTSITNAAVLTTSTSTAIDPGTSAYLAIYGGGSVGYDFGGAETSFSLDIGSIDTYNSLTLNFTDGTSQSFLGSAFPVHTNSRLFFTAASGQFLSGVTLASSINSFEVDNLAIGASTPAVPEPASWAMMIAGFGLVGSALRSARRFSSAITA